MRNKQLDLFSRDANCATMPNKRIIIKHAVIPPLVGVWFCLLWQPGCWADHSPAGSLNSAATHFNLSAEMTPDGIILAEEKRAADKKQPTGAAPTGRTEEKSAANNKAPSSQEKNNAGDLKSFEPSEKVKADQAVDFPYDI
jgi:hypothetical protein